MKRPILLAVIGYIIGIIVGLYFSKSIVLIYVPITVVYYIYKYRSKSKKSKFKLISVKRYLRYIKIYLNSKVIVLIIFSSIVSNTIVIFQNKNYEKIYNNLYNKENINLLGTIISDKQLEKYYNKYKIKVKYNNQNINFYITTKKDIELEYGNKIIITGNYIKPEIQRNYKGFNYFEYLKQLKIYGTIKCEKIEIVGKKQGNKLFEISNKISNKINLNTKEILKKENASILLGLILGNKKDINEETQDKFRNASMSHILAVSGMHVIYIILGIELIFKKIIGKKKTYILSILVLIFYMFITNFSPSITRAGIMSILMIFSKLIHRKNDIYTSISISLFLILIYNPFLIQSLGLLLSYGGVIGIIIFNKSILNILKNIKVKNKFYRYKIKPKIQKQLDKLKEIISVSIAVQISIIPIILYNINTFNPYFLISNLFLSLVIGPIIILSFIFVIIVFLNYSIAKIISPIIQVSIEILNYISNVGKLPFAKIYIATPKIFLILVYYLFLIALVFIYKIYSSRKPSNTQIRIKNLIALIKIKLRRKRKKVKYAILTISFLILIISFIPHNLQIHFIDVGQGDSSLIITPLNKTILIDGGGSSSQDFDVGENTLKPYILDRGYTKIDIVIISHFDQDHIGRNINHITRTKSWEGLYFKTD